MSSKSNLPEMYYYRLESAVKEIPGSTVEHFIHYASTLRLELCVKVNSPDLVKGMGVILDEENLEKRYTSMREGEKNGEPFPSAHYFVDISGRFGHIEMSLIDSPDEDYKAPSDICAVLAIDGHSISKNETALLKGKAVTSGMLYMPRSSESESKDFLFSPYAIWMNECFSFDINDIYVFSDEIEILKNGVDALKNKIRGDAGYSPVIERHSKNRLDVIMAAMSFKERFPNDFNSVCLKPDGSYNFTEWARQVLDRPHLFKDGVVKIKSVDTVQKFISDIYKSPDDRR